MKTFRAPRFALCLALVVVGVPSVVLAQDTTPKPTPVYKARGIVAEVNGDPIIFDDHGYSYDAEDGTHFEIKRSVIANMALNIPSYALPRPMRFCTLK